MSSRSTAALVVALFVLAPARANASAIGVTTAQVTQAIGVVPANALVVASPLESDVAPSPNRADELALRVGALVAGKIPGAHVATRTATLEQARAMASRTPSLVYVRVQIQKSQLAVTVDAYPVVRNVWDRARLPPPPPTSHAYAVAPIDAEVRAFFPPLPLELTSIHRASHAEGDVLAVACGDLDGDGGAELVLVSRDRASIGRTHAGKFEASKTVAWSALAKRVAAPLREPIAGAEIDLGRALLGTSDRGGVIVDEAFGGARATSSGVPIGAGICAPISAARLGFEGSTSACESMVTPTRTALATFDAASAFALVAPSGEERVAIATRENGKLRLRVGGVEKATFENAGAQVAVLDANLDGAPEIAFSNDGGEDAITIATIGDGGAARVVNRIAAPAGVRALAACPPQANGAASLVAIVGNEVWIVR